MRDRFMLTTVLGVLIVAVGALSLLGVVHLDTAVAGFVAWLIP